MEEWLRENLSKILRNPVPEDMTQYIMQIKDEKNLDEFLSDILGHNDENAEFKNEFMKRRRAYINDNTNTKKINNKDSLNRKQKDKKKGKVKPKEVALPQEVPKPEKTEKKKPKFVNLYSTDGQNRLTVLLEGRHKCNCEAKRHTLINNCLNCGRIVCKQEGAGPCFFCGELVCSPKDQAILDSNTKRGDTLYNKLMYSKPSKSFEDSIKQRDKLLEYDRNSYQCTKVIDDESDYYQSSNIWINPAEREKLQKHEEEMSARKQASRLNKKITIDFMGREIIEEDDPIDQFSEEQFKELCESIPFDELNRSNVCPTIEFDRPTYVEMDNVKSYGSKMNERLSTGNRIQDKEYLEISDQGLCLSMHQPYASLLVAGIKTHEGRTWYSSHRGRLWIASTSKPPTKEEISNLEHFYRNLKSEKLKFPESYPTSSLLGCVTVVDVLHQEEYRKVYPDGENDSPYVFICENPYTLPFKFPIQGKHKIYKLDQKIHQAAVKILEKVLKGSDN